MKDLDHILDTQKNPIFFKDLIFNVFLMTLAFWLRLLEKRRVHDHVSFYVNRAFMCIKRRNLINTNLIGIL